MTVDMVRRERQTKQESERRVPAGGQRTLRKEEPSKKRNQVGGWKNK